MRFERYLNLRYEGTDHALGPFQTQEPSSMSSGEAARKLLLPRLMVQQPADGEFAKATAEVFKLGPRTLLLCANGLCPWEGVDW